VKRLQRKGALLSARLSFIESRHPDIDDLNEVRPSHRAVRVRRESAAGSGLIEARIVHASYRGRRKRFDS
jgi:hypothetical protein